MHCEMIATVTTSNIEASCVPGPDDTERYQLRAGQVSIQRELTHLCGRERNVHKQWEVLRGENKEQRYR